MTPGALRTAFERERRTNARLRAVIEEIRAEVRANRRDLDLQFKRIAQLQVDIDTLTRVQHKGKRTT